MSLSDLEKWQKRIQTFTPATDQIAEKKIHAVHKSTTAADTPPKNETEQNEIGGPKGPEPTRYGDWEHNGLCSDF